MILSSLVCRLLAPWTTASPIPSRFFSPPMGSRDSASNRTSFACGLLAPWVAASPTHNQGTSSPYGQQGRTRHPNWKGIDLDLILLSQRLRKPNRVITGKSKMAWCQNHIKLTGYIILKHISLCLGNYKKTLNNLTSTKFVRFSTSFLSKDFLTIFHITRQDKHL